MQDTPRASGQAPSPIDRLVRFCLEFKPVVFLGLVLAVLAGLSTAPFDWDLGPLHRAPVAVDAIPDIGENQQIVFTEWPGRSPQDVEDQVTYPITVALLGVPGIKTVRSSSEFGTSSVYAVFDDSVDFYWARTRLLEKLASLPPDLLPAGVRPQLGPDATALGQVYWYTLEGRDEQGRSTGGWDPFELRSAQDFVVRYALSAVPGVAEVAGVGGHVREYQVDVDPDLLRAYDVTLAEVARAVQRGNIDVGARTFEVSGVEYLIRGLGFIKRLEDLKNAVVTTRDNVPVLVSHVAQVAVGPALRTGALDKDGAEAVGGVVVVRYGDNPMAVIKKVKQAVARIAPSLPSKTLDDGRVSRVTVVPFYDRTELIRETLGTLDDALVDETLVTAIVVLAMLAHLGSALVVAFVLPVSVLLTFAAMKAFGVDANIVALSGIAIAIGTMVDMGIILTENVLRHLKESGPDEDRMEVVHRASREVGGAIVTAVSTTIVSFLPVFAMTGPEGKLFHPLAFTKTMALSISLVAALALVPPMAHLFFRRRKKAAGPLGWELLIYAGAVLGIFADPRAGAAVAAAGVAGVVKRLMPERHARTADLLITGAVVAAAGAALGAHWLPLGPARGLAANLAFTALVLGSGLGFFSLFRRLYPAILAWCLDHKAAFLALPCLLLAFGAMVWLGFPALSGWMPRLLTHSAPGLWLAGSFPGLSKEFMPPLDEGSFLLMPSTMPHASIREVQDILRRQDTVIQALPEVENAVGKLGRADSALDPAPVSMIETVITYHQEYLTDEQGSTPRFRYDADAEDWARAADGRLVSAPDGMAYRVRGAFARDEAGKPIPDPDGMPLRIWRAPLDPELNPGREPWAGVRSPDDIWQAITAAARLPGVTEAPKLQPISARLVMLQSGIRAAMAVKVTGPDLGSIQEACARIEAVLRDAPKVEPATVIADRIVAKPYVEIDIDRAGAAQYGLDVQEVQDVIETALGGSVVTTTVEGRERYGVRVRYLRELRDDFDALRNVLVEAPGGARVPLAQIARLRYTPGPAMIRTEDAFLTGYVLFDKKRGATEIDAVSSAGSWLDAARESGRLELPPGTGYAFTGTWENQVRAEARLMIILPVTLLLIVLILYLQFRSLTASAIVFSSVAVAWAGGFTSLWLYAQPWFLNFSVMGANLRELFHMGPVSLSLPVWVGFLALFGIAEDDGVVMATYIEERQRTLRPASPAQIRNTVIEAGLKRVRPCLMTTATTILALVPALGSSGRGADILVPMAIPSFGGMCFVMVTMFVVPVLYAWMLERRLARQAEPGGQAGG